MARRQRQREPDPEDIGKDEVDEFADEKEQILLEKAGWNNREEDSGDGLDQEQSVMNIDEDDEERYPRKLQGPVDEDEEEYFVDKDKDPEEEEDDPDKWGSKADYYGADDVEEEDEEDAKEMEKEALRLQKKHLEELNMEDYMMDEEGWEEESIKNVEEKEQDTVDISKLDTKSQRQLLEKQYPEFIPLTKEFQTLRPTLDELKEKRAEGEIAEIKYSTLASYLGTVASYFALFLAKLHEGEQFSMKDETIMEDILQTREIWYEAKGLSAELLAAPESEVDEEIEAESGEEIELMDDSSVAESEASSSEVENESESDEDSDEEETFGSAIKHLRKSRLEDIDEIDSEDKSARKRTLGFYTSKIDQREKKKFTKFQGDEDIPYRERLFERQQRLVEEARRRGDKNNSDAPGVNLGDDVDESGNDDEGIPEGEDYYEQVKSKKAAKKASRRQAHESAVKAARLGKLSELQENIDDNGKRAINYQIMKNKGLTKKRKKVDRNARVKKRVKFANAEKKIRSMRAVYKKPEGPYQGEQTGIKKNVSRSVKLV